MPLLILSAHTFSWIRLNMGKEWSSPRCVIERAALATGGGEIGRQCQFASIDMFGIMLEVLNWWIAKVEFKEFKNY